MRWHIDYFLQAAEVSAVVAVPSSSKEIECRVAEQMLAIPGACVPLAGFGSSDCGCPAHLIYLGEDDVESVAETVVYRISMLGCIYPDRVADRRGRGRRRQ